MYDYYSSYQRSANGAIAGIIIGSILAFGLTLLINYFIAKSFYNIACEKGHYQRKYFHFCFWLGVAGWIMVAALPDRRGYDNRQPVRYVTPAPPVMQNQNAPAAANYVQPQQKADNERGAADNAQIIKKWKCCSCGIMTDSLTCHYCGKRSVPEGKKVCPSCGFVQNDNRSVCWECGAPI